MRTLILLAPALIAVCVGCGGGGSGSSVSQTHPVISGTATTPPMASFQYGQPITLQWSLTGAAPTSISLEAFGQGTLSLNPLATSAVVTPSHPITYTVIVENGKGADSATWTFTQLPSTTTLVSSASPSVSGQPVTLTATVTLGATGIVSFSDTSAATPLILGSGAVSSGTATFTTSALALGPHAIIAGYSGDQDFAPSQSAALTQSVTP